MSITAIIPVRAGSTRVKDKNIRPFGDSSLLVEKIRQLKKVDRVDTVLVTSDSDKMLEIAAREGCLTQKRPYEYCDEKTKSFNEVVEYVASQAPGDLLIWAPCVSPFCDENCFNKGLDDYFEKTKNGEFDSVISCKRFKEYLWDENGPHNYSAEHHIISQDLPNWSVISNGFFIAPRDLMIQRKYIFGYKPYITILSKIECIDIDDEFDFEFAEYVYRQRKK